MTKEPFYVTSPIYYVNDVPHIGHAYTNLACDVMARFKQLEGGPVYFLTGTDEHGQKVEKTAKERGVSPQAYTDQVSQSFRHLADVMQLSHHDFIRTTEPRHIHAAQALWQKLEANGTIYLSSYAGWYAVRDEAFYQESELIEGKAPTGAPVEWVEEPSYFFKLSAFQEPLLAWYRENPTVIFPETRRNEVMRFVEGGLKDLSISRSTFSWGVPVPGDPAHIMYVWLDALTNYISALGYATEDTTLLDRFWPVATHVVGKDIVRFHAVYWPAFLMAADLPLPKQIVAHGWWTNEGQKISKSLGNVIDPFQLIENYGLDPVRYFLMREVPFGADGNFSHEGLKRRIHSELSNTIGNLMQRTLKMVHSACEGRIPKPLSTPEPLQAHTMQMVEEVARHLEAHAFHLALESIQQLAIEANVYIDREAPWQLKKTDPARMEHVLYTLMEAMRPIALLLQPFMPQSAARMLDQLGVPPAERLLIHAAPEYALAPGVTLPEPMPIFPRYQE